MPSYVIPQCNSPLNPLNVRLVPGRISSPIRMPETGNPHVVPSVVPNVVGDTQLIAESNISLAGLVVGSVTFAVNSAPAGHVVSQSPVAGSLVASGSAVDLIISTGAAPSISVPNIVGENQTTAQLSIFLASLAVGTVSHAASSSVPVGFVISQSPPPGTLVPNGFLVSFVVSVGPLRTISVYGKFIGSAVFPPVLIIDAKGLKPRIYMPRENTTVKT
jgi:beta-lactam-binding protein with PASTA domain